ncbi:ATP-grasp fold amidoligase family protein [Helicobacter saguini]|uniref:Uncharacterized protein n=1 Tax=Helicobacter saguini TaxID=1548018 RepID=A0A6L7DIW6_9HELI|nr:ATP-grasp fold amidoligase family protein [Helicobacter saguini]MWV70378.1 hypothetical protein [Helicobacter saguini]
MQWGGVNHNFIPKKLANLESNSKDSNPQDSIKTIKNKIDCHEFANANSLNNKDSKNLENPQHFNSVDSINQYFIESKNNPVLALLNEDSKLDSISSQFNIPKEILKTLFSPIDFVTKELFYTNNCPFLPKLYGIYKNTKEIDFEALPNSFVLKTNHDCGGVVIVENKQGLLENRYILEQMLQKLEHHLHSNYYDISREYHYKAIESRIFAEEMLYEKQDKTTKIPENFRYFTFQNADKLIIQVDDANYEHTHIRHFYDDKWNFLPFTYNFEVLKDEIKKPAALNTMNKIARILLGNFSFIRIDLYALDKKVYVGELTFTPFGGSCKFKPSEYDKILGDMWK